MSSLRIIEDLQDRVDDQSDEIELLERKLDVALAAIKKQEKEPILVRTCLTQALKRIEEMK